MSRRRKLHEGPPRVLAYLRVSTDEQRDSGAGLEAQRLAISREAEAQGWQDVMWITDAGLSAKSLDRPGLRNTLELLERGEAEVLVVSKLDRLSRSVFDFAKLTKLAAQQGWALRVLDISLDMRTPQGEMMANVIASFAQYERQIIGQRTRDAMAAKRANGGKRQGRPPELPDDVRRRILAMRAESMSYTAIAAQLNAEKVPTAQGGEWWPSTIRWVERSAARLMTMTEAKASGAETE